MTEFSGKKYKLAGFDIVQKGTLVDVFARFCDLDQDPANLPKTRSMTLFRGSEPAEVPCIYPRISADQIAGVILGSRDIAQRSDQVRLPTSPEDILADLGPEKLALLIPQMARVRNDYIRNEQNTFMPVVTGGNRAGPA